MIHHLVFIMQGDLGGGFFDGEKVLYKAGNTVCMCVPTYLGAGLMAVTDEPLRLSI